MRPRPLHRPTRTTAAQNRPAACVPRGSAADRARLSDGGGGGVPPAGAGACPGEGRGHSLLHLGQKLIASRLLLLGPVFRLGKAALTLHRFHLNHSTRQILPNPGPKRDYFSVSLVCDAI